MIIGIKGIQSDKEGDASSLTDITFLYFTSIHFFARMVEEVFS